MYVRYLEIIVPVVILKSLSNLVHIKISKRKPDIETCYKSLFITKSDQTTCVVAFIDRE